jgi:hypothetical protein
MMVGQLLEVFGVLVIAVAVVLAASGLVALFWWHRRLTTEDQRRITALIEQNRAQARPGMARRDDLLMRRAEDRARQRRTTR